MAASQKEELKTDDQFVLIIFFIVLLIIILAILIYSGVLGTIYVASLKFVSLIGIAINKIMPSYFQEAGIIYDVINENGNDLKFSWNSKKYVMKYPSFLLRDISFYGLKAVLRKLHKCRI